MGERGGRKCNFILSPIRSLLNLVSVLSSFFFCKKRVAVKADSSYRSDPLHLTLIVCLWMPVMLGIVITGRFIVKISSTLSV